MKRMLPILLVLAVLFALLVSCEASEKEETATETVEETVDTVAPKPSTTTAPQKKPPLNMGIDEKDIGWDWNN